MAKEPIDRCPICGDEALPDKEDALTIDFVCGAQIQYHGVGWEISKECNKDDD